MESDAPLDFALFQLSPRRQRCELVVSGNGRTEKIASGSVKPFVAHLRAAEEQASAQPPPPAIRLQLERRAPWFSKGTLERFVRFVSTPEVLESANNYDLEMSQLEGARKIYAQGGTGDATSGAAGENVTASAAAAAADVTKKELLRAIDVRLSALKQDLAAACSRASSAGFNPNTVSELILFANHFGANRLSEACTKFMTLCQRHPDISPQNAPPAVSSHWKGFDDGNVRGSSSSDMSIDEPQVDLGESNNKSTVGGSDSQIHRLSNSQGSIHVSSEPVPEQQTKSTMQQAADKQEAEESPAPAVGVSRRLSVKDRISMFEGQKKEQTPSSGNSTSTGTGRVVPGKGEHRRVPSGASMEKLVRRWSSVSDMSIDLSNNDSSNLNDRKENGTPIATPTSKDLEANSKAGVDEGSSELKDSVTSQPWPCQKDNVLMDSTTKNLCPAPNLSNGPAPNNESAYSAEDDMVINSSIESESSFGKEPGVIQGHTRMSNKADSNVSTRSRLKTSAKPVEETLLKDKDSLTSPSSEEHFRMIDKEIEGVAHEVPVSSEKIPQDDTRGPRLHTKDIRTEAEVIGRKDRPSRTFEKVSGGVKSKASSNSRANVRGSSGRDEVASTETEVHDVRVQRNRPAGKAEDVGRKVTAGSDSDCSGRQGTNLSRQSSITDQEFNQARIRPGKGNQDRHGELQMKASELEKLFAAHMLASSRRVKPTDVQVDSTPVVSEVKPIAVLPETIYTKQVVKESITTNDCDANELLKMVNNQGYNISTPQKLGILSLEESRGKFYEQYMQKRDAKLKEDWKVQREEKEAMLKAMHESLERSKAEMLAKFSRSADLPDSTYVSHYSQKIPPLQSARKNKDQGVDSFLVEEELNSDYQSGDGSSRSADSRKHFSNKVASTQNQKTHVAPIHKRSSRTVSSGYANRRNPPENSLVQSVPNFSNLRKENTRPSPGLSRDSRATARVQQKSFARSKSIIEESKNILKEDQSRRSQSMRKSQIPDELKDIPSVNEDVYNWAPSRISNNQSEGAFAYNTRRTGPPKAFLRKGNGTHPVVGIAGFQAAAAMMANALQHNESSGDFEDHQEDSPDDAKDEEEYESIDENLRESDFPADSDSENPRVSHEFRNSDDPGSENDDVHFPSEVPGLGGTKFTAFTGNVHNPTGDLPAPWSSRLPQLFPYANDNSDGDAFADSPSGSPSPWNSHSLDEITDADVSRMRKKWGSAQMPFAGVNASQQPRKDVSKGLKKLWKFGRKNRGGDGLVNDWVSASTASECDDDMEDGRDLAVGSSDDFRKSRMGYLASYDGFVENEAFAEQEQSIRSSIPNPPANFRLREDQLSGSSLKAPRSFFSLSTFRSKGGDAKLR